LCHLGGDGSDLGDQAIHHDYRVQYPPDEVADIKYGSDIGHVLPSELALLADPALEALFFHRYAEGQQIQYELLGNEKQGQGPIILAVDTSVSMTEALGGISKDVWAKAVMLALMAIARLQERDEERAQPEPKLICTTDALGEIAAENEARQVTDELRQIWETYRHLYLSEDLGRMMRAIVEEIPNTIRTRKGGTVYFVPHSEKGTLLAF
jgi:hypothetical protein